MKYDYHSVPGIIHPPPPGALQCSFRVHDEQDNRVATCWVEGNARLVVDALNSHATLRSRVEALASVVRELVEVIEHPDVIGVASGDCHHISNPGSPMHLNTNTSWLTLNPFGSRSRATATVKANKLRAAIAKAIALLAPPANEATGTATAGKESV